MARSRHRTCSASLPAWSGTPGRKVFLILDRLQVHRAATVREWLAGARQIEVFYLPAYSPELNPDEGVNGDLKQAVTRKAGPQQGAAQARRRQPHAPPVEAARARPQLLPPSDIPLRSMTQEHPSQINNRALFLFTSQIAGMGAAGFASAGGCQDNEGPLNKVAQAIQPR